MHCGAVDHRKIVETVRVQLLGAHATVEVEEREVKVRDHLSEARVRALELELEVGPRALTHAKRAKLAIAAVLLPAALVV